MKLSTIIQNNKIAGDSFFENSSNEISAMIYYCQIYIGVGGIFFIYCSMFTHTSGYQVKKFKIAQYDHINHTIIKVNECINLIEAQLSAVRLSEELY